MNIALCQYDIAWENPGANFAKIESLLSAAGIPNGSMIVLPEMCATGFTMDVDKAKEEDPSRGEAFLSNLAAQYQSCVIGGLVSQAPDGKGRNEALAFTPDEGLIARYQKMQPFTLAGEMDFYEPGEAILAFSWGDFTVTPFICYDLRFPELFRPAARQGADLYVVIANWPAPRVNHWVTLLQARAIENQAFVIGVNRIGEAPDHTYPGRSLVVNPHGEIIADAGEEETILLAEIDAAEAAQWRADFPALNDMREEAE